MRSTRQHFESGGENAVIHCHLIDGSQTTGSNSVSSGRGRPLKEVWEVLILEGEPDDLLVRHEEPPDEPFLRRSLVQFGRREDGAVDKADVLATSVMTSRAKRSGDRKKPTSVEGLV